MSLLEAIKRKQKTLKPAETTVTYADGRQITEPSGENSSIRVLQPKPYGFIVDTKPDHVPACILEAFLYLGSQDAASSDNVNLFKWTHILSVGIETPEFKDNNTAHDVTAKFLPCLDLPETDLFDVIREGVLFLKNVKSLDGSVLVHCNAGVSRSASIVIAYLMLEMGMKFQEAYAFVKSKRSCVQPNVGFVSQLKQLEKM